MRLTFITLLLGLLFLCGFSSSLQAQLYINEFMASNSNTIADEFGEYDDWIEIYNAGTSPVNLAGYFISDDNDIPTKWQIPNSDPLKTTVPAGGFLLLWADVTPFQGANHLNFKLSVLGERITLYEPNGSVLVDKKKFGAHYKNVSEGRHQDGVDGFLPFTYPTPGATNGNVCGVTPEGILINEINYKSDFVFNPGDWVELHNPTTSVVDISGWRFHDEDSFFTIPNGTMIGPKGYFVLAEDNNFFNASFPDVSNYLGNFGLTFSGGGEQLRIFSETGCLVQEMEYDDDFPWTEEADGLGATVALIDPSRDNDLAGSWVSSTVGGAPHGTPGAANNIPDPCVSNNTGVVINEINYNSNPAMDPGNWLEVHNPTSTPVDLSGWEIHDADSAFVFPQGTSLAADGYLVVVENPFQFFSVFPDVPNFLGTLGFALNNGGEKLMLYNPQRCMIDSVRYRDNAPWPLEPDGVGPSLSLLDPALDNSIGESWGVSTGFGTPGKKNEFSCLQGTAELSSYNTVNELVFYCRKGNWNYYYNNSSPNSLLFAIEHKPAEFGGNTADIELKVTLTTTLFPGSSSNFLNGIFKKDNIAAQEAIFGMGRYWNVDYLPGSPQVNGTVNIRYYFGLDEISAINDAAGIWNKDNFNNALTVGQPIWFKTVDHSYDPETDLSPIDVENSIALTPVVTSIEDGTFYVQFNGIESFSGGSAVVRVSKGDPVLPIDLVSFSGTNDECSIQLEWETATEVNFSHFEIEKSADGSNYSAFGRLDSRGSAANGYEYDFEITENIHPINYFRLKVIDLDGSFAYSEVITVKSECYKEGQISISEIFPNPATDKANFQLVVPFSEEQVSINIVSISGKMVQSNFQMLEEGANLFSINTERLAPGIYFVQVVGSEWKTTPQKLVKVDF